MVEISLTKIIGLVTELKRKIEKYRDKLVRNEMLVRYALVDPLLRALGWNTENPEQVEPEYLVEGERPDYALKLGEKIVAFVEVKSLNGITEDIIKDKLRYSIESGVKYTVITDGNLWMIYDVFKEVPWKDREICRWNITEEDPATVAIKALTMANTSAFGKLAERPVFEKQVEKQVGMQPVITKTVAGKIKGPISCKKAEYLVLRVLAETEGPKSAKDILGRIQELAEFTESDLRENKYGHIRWKDRIYNVLRKLDKEGKVTKHDRGLYAISEEGKSHLKVLEKELLRTP